jgi:hypothetical protein
VGSVLRCSIDCHRTAHGDDRDQYDEGHRHQRAAGQLDNLDAGDGRVACLLSLRGRQLETHELALVGRATHAVTLVLYA